MVEANPEWGDEGEGWDDEWEEEAAMDYDEPDLV